MFRRKKDDSSATARLRAQEDPAVQMRIIRTHIAAQATEIGNLAAQQRDVLAALDRVEVLIREQTSA